MPKRRKPARDAAARIAVAAAGGAAALCIGLVVTSIPVGRAQPAAQGLEQMAQAEPEPNDARQAQEDAAGAER